MLAKVWISSDWQEYIVRLPMGDTEKNLMILQYCDVISW